MEGELIIIDSKRYLNEKESYLLSQISYRTQELLSQD